MCGIFGHFAQEESNYTDFIKLDRAKKAIKSLEHRGPDDSGFWISDNGKTILGHVRLSIIDLNSRASQPMLSSSQGSVLVFNGEIYNFLDLKHKFSINDVVTTSDTEVLLIGLERYGADFLNELDGMFSLAFFDVKKQSTLLATDPMGKKPLYTYYDGKNFAFASEIKSFKSLNLDLEVEDQSIMRSLLYGYIPQPNTLYKQVKKLPPGSYQYFSYQKGLSETQKYWDLSDDLAPNRDKISEIKMHTRFLIKESVKKRLISDVPIGVLLSGGLDSSIITYEAQEVSYKPIKTYTASFSNNKLSNLYDESKYALDVAQQIGAMNKLVNINAHSMDFDKIMTHFDEPYFDSSAIPFYYVCKEASKDVKVLLSGDGADEVFGGYRRFQALLWQKYFPVLNHLPSIKLNQFSRSKLGYLERFMKVSGLPIFQKLTELAGIFSLKELENLLKSSLEDEIENFKFLENKTHGMSFSQKILYYNIQSYLHGDLLPKVDRMSMANGVEIRSPFLDKSLVKYIFSISGKYKFDLFQKKKLLKSIYKKHLDPDIVYRKKQGFGFPIENQIDFGKPQINNWMKKHLKIDSFDQVHKTNQKFALWGLNNLLNCIDDSSKLEKKSTNQKIISHDYEGRLHV